MRVQYRAEQWPTLHPFTITGRTWTEVEVMVVELEADGVIGRGEAFGNDVKGETLQTMAAQVRDVAGAVREGADRAALLHLLPAGGARNAIDCAMWDLEAQRRGQPVWKLAGLEAPKPLLTTCTVGADDPQVMAARAREHAGARAIKLKLTGEAVDHDRVRAVRDALPEAWLAVDANQGLSETALERLMPILVEAEVAMLEQPLAVGRDQALKGFRGPVPLAADESVDDLPDLEGLVGLYDIANLKLDKCGGLTRGLQMVEAARALGLRLMVGNMLGTSLAMAPAFLLGQSSAVVDLDGPLLLAKDRAPGATYQDGRIFCDDDVWGGGARPPKGRARWA